MQERWLSSRRLRTRCTTFLELRFMENEVRGEIARARENPRRSRGHHYWTSILIYCCCCASFFRCRYAFCLHPSEHVLASRRVAVNSSPQISQTFLRSSVLFSLRS